MTGRADIDELENRLRNLVVSARRGNKDSYKNLLRDILPFLRRNAGSLMNRFGYAHLGEDVVQEILLAIHLKLHTYDERQPFLAWLRAVMKHKAIDCLRRQNQDTVSIDEENFIELSDTTASAEERIVTRDLKFLLSQLKPPAGDIIYDFKVDGASVKELSEKYALSEGNIKVIVHRGLEKLSAFVMKDQKQ